MITNEFTQGVPTEKKADVTQALQTYTTGQLGIPNYVEDKAPFLKSPLYSNLL